MRIPPPTTIAHALVLVLLVVVLPIWDRAETRQLRANPTSDNRVRSYQKTIAWLWATAIFLLLTTPFTSIVSPPTDERVLAILGSGTAPRTLSLGISIGLLAGLALPVILAWTSAAARAKIVAQWSAFAFFLPQSTRERRWFAAVCISAGICEEVIFRGFLIRYLAGFPIAFGVLGAIVIAAVIFGWDHGYQGWKGMVLTGLLALLMTALFLLSGSLWVPIVFHALLDLRILLMGPFEQETAVTL